MNAPSKPTDALVAALAETLAPLLRGAIADALADLWAAEVKPPALLTRAELAHELRISVRMLDLIRAEGMPEIRIGESPRFELAPVLEWLRARGQ